MPTSAASKQTHLAKMRRKNLLDYTCKLQPVVSFRCSQMVTARKGFSIHRSCNVLTLSLKRFSVFSGEKILKVPEKYWHCAVGVIAKAIYWDHIKNLCCAILRVSHIWSTWTCDLSCLSPKGNRRCTTCMLYWSTQDSAVTPDITSVTSRYYWPHTGELLKQ